MQDQTNVITGDTAAAQATTPNPAGAETPTQAPDPKATPETLSLVPAASNGTVALGSFEDEGAALLANFVSGESALFFSTIKNDGERSTQIKMYNAIAEAVSLRDNVNKEIVVTDYMAHPVKLLDEETGEVANVLRVILVCEDGSSFAAMSGGIRNSIERIVAMAGPAPWAPGIRMVAVEKAVKSSAVNRVLTLRLVADTATKK